MSLTCSISYIPSPPPGVTKMNVYYRQCLYVCKALHDNRRQSMSRRYSGYSPPPAGPATNTGATCPTPPATPPTAKPHSAPCSPHSEQPHSTPSSATTTCYGVEDIAYMANSTVADHLLYAHVMEMCQSAATDELFGMTNEVLILFIFGLCYFIL